MGAGTVLLVLGLVLVGCGRSSSYGPDDLLFASERYGPSNIYTRNLHTSGRDVFKEDHSVPLLPLEARRDPTWAPDGKRLAFVSDQDSVEVIYVAQRDGTGRTPVASSEEVSGLVWSPDGSRIAYVTDGLYTVRPDGTKRTQVTESGFRPAWSPDGDRIAYVYNRESDYDIYTIRPDGSGRTQVTTTEESKSDLTWSPDGSRIAYVSHPGYDSTGVYTIRPDGTGRTHLSSAAQNPTWAPTGTRLAFVSNKNYDVYTIRPDGSGLTHVTKGSAEDVPEIAWSPDGARIAFLSVHDPDNPVKDKKDELYLIQPDGSDRTRITSGGGRNPRWSPDGERIAFVSDRRGDDEVYVGPPDGTAFEPIGRGWARTDPTLSRYSPLTAPYTPYCPTVACTSGRHGNADIYTLVPGGGTATQVTDDSAADADPTWAPDRPRLAFASTRDGDSDIYTIGLDGTDPRPVTDHEAVDTDPDWGAGGWLASARIAFVSDRDGNDNLYTIAPDGSGLAQITDHDATDADPAWSPDGDRIAFASDRDGSFNIYTMAPDGSDLRQITDHEAADTEPAWRASGTAISFVTDQDDKPEIYEIDADGGGRRSSITDKEATDPDWGLTSLDHFLWDIRQSAVQ